MTNTSSLNAFYRDYSETMILLLIATMLGLLLAVCVVFYQVTHHPLPEFSAAAPDGKRLQLKPYTEPSLVPGALLHWASKAAALAYTFDFVNYNKALDQVRPYFTSSGWSAYQSAVRGLINRVKQRQLFVAGVVSGAPVITLQGDAMQGFGYSWQVQLPFLVTYFSSEESRSEKYYVILTIVKVPTTTNPDGVGIEQFDMVRG